MAFTLASVTLSAIAGFAVTRYVLNVWQLDYLRTPAIVLATAIIILVTRPLAKRKDRTQRIDVLTLLTNQCALLGVGLFTSAFSQSFTGAMSCGIAIAFSLVVLSSAFKSLMERIDNGIVPFAFRGIPIALITAGFMALALMGFAGIVKN